MEKNGHQSGAGGRLLVNMTRGSPEGGKDVELTTAALSGVGQGHQCFSVTVCEGGGKK